MAQMFSLVLLAAGLPAARAAPDWCKWVPDGSLQYVNECNGYSHASQTLTQGCVSWCEWVPAASWQVTPQCRGCQSLYPNHAMANSSFANDTCANWCQHVSRPAWQYTPECTTCDQDLSNAKTAKTPEVAAPASFVATKSAGGPDWCKWIPYGSLQYVPACSGGWGNTYQAPTVQAGVFGCLCHPGATLLSANVAPALGVSTPSKDVSIGVSGSQGQPGRTLQNVSDALKSRATLTGNNDGNNDGNTRTILP
eukprot:CAMPEP_0114697078 /NCGR_PEP_ID=MMETSP0191-20121206/73369_1 /TAXON_ID=126664 /ORGANISM="Sorites sp." /LENGTH=251 /DNA_ID=CAMNT_0001995703 /DNA_START=56 /DNA_END=812 /DNA_ORIENTATION=-